MHLLLIAPIVIADVLAAAYCGRHLYYAMKGRYSPETAWVKARIESRHLDREHAELTRVNPRG